MVAVLALLLVAVLGGGGFAWWYTMQESSSQENAEPLQQQALSPPPAESTPVAPKQEPASPARKPEMDVAITAKPQSDAPQPEAPQETEAGTARDSGPSAATKSYAWVLKSKCSKLPQVERWKFKNHFDLVRHVNRQHSGDWQPYIRIWVDRLAKLQDIYSRNSGIKTRGGGVLSGDSLKAYIDQTQQRLDVTICLSREAAEYAYKKTLMQR